MAQIFMSYRRSETRHVAGRLRDRLAEHFGSANVNMDIDAVGVGVDYVLAIEHAIASCQILIALVGPDWTVVADRQGRRLDNPHDPVVMEIRTAFDNNIRIIPVLIDGAAMPHQDDLPTAIDGFSRLNALRLDHETFRTDAELLIAGIEQALPEAGPHLKGYGRVGTSIARSGDHRASVWPPWGLRDAAVLRGRDELVAEVINRYLGDSAGKRVWVLHGLGGVGKTRVALEVALQAQREDADVWWVSATDTAEFVSGIIDLAPASGSHADAERLAHRLGGLPLALHLAGAALAEVSAMPSILVGDSDSPGTFAQYGRALNKQFATLFPSTSSEVVADPHQALQLVGQTWQLSLTQLSSAGFPDARPLLRLLACFGEAPIPYGLLLNPSILARSSLFPDITGRRLWDVLQELDGLNLITLSSRHAAGPTGFTATLHPLVRETNAVRPDHDQPPDYPMLAARLIAACAADTPVSEADDSPDTWPRWLALAPQAFHVLRQLEAASRGDTDVAAGACRAATLAARCHVGIGLYEQAETELRTTLNIACLLLGEQHPEALAARHQLARVLYERGRLPQAAAELEIVLEARRRTLGEEDPGTLATRNQLAWTLRGQGLHNEAKQELEVLIRDKTRVLGPEHPDTLVARMDLAEVLHEQGQHERAAAEYADVLAARRRILGDDHRKTLNTRHFLARLWYDQGRLAEAATAYSEVLATRQRILGDDHPRTLSTRHDLAITLEKLGQHAHAAAELREVHDARRRVLGESHPDTLASAQSLRRVQR